MRGATPPPMIYRRSSSLFQSTLLMRGATWCHWRHAVLNTDFNPRSSCEERLHCSSYVVSVIYFNPRSSCEERHDCQLVPKSHCRKFQSTLLMRGATRMGRNRSGTSRPISIHAPHARSDVACVAAADVAADISIHAPHARSDAPIKVSSICITISIHAPHARSDVKEVIS